MLTPYCCCISLTSLFHCCHHHAARRCHSASASQQPTLTPSPISGHAVMCAPEYCPNVSPSRHCMKLEPPWSPPERALRYVRAAGSPNSSTPLHPLHSSASLLVLVLVLTSKPQAGALEVATNEGPHMRGWALTALTSLPEFKTAWEESQQ